MRDLTINEMDMVFGGSGQTGSGSNGSVYGPVDRNDPYGRNSNYPSGRDAMNGGATNPNGSAGSNPSLNTGTNFPIGNGATATGGYYGSPSNPSGVGGSVTIPLGGSK